MIRGLKATTKPKKANADGVGEGGEFDLLVVERGATGAGIAVDAASRRLKVAFVERFDFQSSDFSSGAFHHLIHAFILIVLLSETSSKLTKFVVQRYRYICLK